MAARASTASSSDESPLLIITFIYIIYISKIGPASSCGIIYPIPKREYYLMSNIKNQREVSEGGQRSNKRKSPSVTTPLFRIPLSRMLLSPRIQVSRTQIRSPLVMSHGTRIRDIDLNMEPQDSQENTESGSHSHENEGNGSNLECF
ncbi:hypothetical protein U9M48_027907 [Paspalum notatum var. saurae]|uniref:Uncharacterized protein n=1 Tax=Paspalum notatum var. saurae TaxID=547442 RepID=A0AAQ3TW37_PASNO